MIGGAANAIHRLSITIGESISVDRSFRVDYDNFNGMRQFSEKY
jgi:hypothetical protein